MSGLDFSEQSALIPEGEIEQEASVSSTPITHIGEQTSDLESVRENTEIAPVDYDDSELRTNLGDEIYDIFVEEMGEILDNLHIWIPQWSGDRDNTEQLTDIRRSYHTCKGSGRMVGGLALGDYAWAHENMLNKVLADELPRNDWLNDLMARSLDYLHQYKGFFLTASSLDEQTQLEIDEVERFVAQSGQREDVANTDEIDTQGITHELSPDNGFLIPGDHVDSAAMPGEAQPLQSEGTVEGSNDGAALDRDVEPSTGQLAEAALPWAEVDEQQESRIVWEMFREELPEQLQNIDQFMQSLYQEPRNANVRQSLERELHTLKGGARMAQLVEMGDVAHQAEELLMLMGRDRTRDSDEDIEKLQAHVDLISDMAEQHTLSEVPVMQIEDVEDAAAQEEQEEDTELTPTLSFLAGASGQDSTYGSLLEQLLVQQAADLPALSVLSGLEEESDSSSGQNLNDSAGLLGQEQIRLSASYLDRMVEEANTLYIQQNTLSERLLTMGEDVGEFGRTASRLKQLLRSLELETEAQIHAGYRQSFAANGRGADSDFDPLEMDEYSEIQRLSRALAESLNDLVNIEGDLAAQLRSTERFLKESQQSGKDLHHNLLATRLVEISVVIPRLRRIIRQASAELDRKAVLEVDGETLKLDRHLLQRMTAPIEHILRNSIAHGIEAPDVREKLGKPAGGTIHMKIFRDENEVVFQIHDDGSGLDTEKIRQRALEQGLIAEQEQLSTQEIQRLILKPGFTTAKTVSKISGRGVGMDVVSSEIKAMGGNLLIDSDPGQGTEFTIRLPFAMAANPVLFVNVQDEQYALPIGSVLGLSRLDAEAVQKHLGQDDKPLDFGDETFPLHYLGPALGHRRPLDISDEGVYPVVFTRASGHCVAWVVDAISGRRDVVLQSLGSLFRNCRYYSAATITAEGDVVMVPDMLDLIERILTTPDAERTEPELQRREDAPRQVHERPHILVIDDSITVRKVTEKLLLHENYIVETAKDGLEALEKLNGFEPDLALLDIEMPRMDGFEVLSAVRANPRWKDLPVIMISSRTAEKHRDHALQLGATDFLGKPYQNQDLLDHIRKHAEQDESLVEEALV